MPAFNLTHGTAAKVLLVMITPVNSFLLLAGEVKGC
jgi:hypothetical protein